MTTETLERMKSMRFLGMARAFTTSLESGMMADWTADEVVTHLVDTEWHERHNRNIERGLKNAKFRYKAALEDLQYCKERNIDKNLVMRLSVCSFIDKHENVLITGSTGIGKSLIAPDLGHDACRQGIR